MNEMQHIGCVQHDCDECQKTRAEMARLHASEQRLLEALNLLLAGIEGSVSETFIPLVKAHAAIAKATGQEGGAV